MPLSLILPAVAALAVVSPSTTATDVERAYERARLSAQRQHYDLAAQTLAATQRELEHLAPDAVDARLVDDVAREFAKVALICHKAGDSRWLDPSLNALDRVLEQRTAEPPNVVELRDAIVNARRERDQLSGLTIAGVAVTVSAAIGGGLLATGLVLGQQSQNNYETGPTREVRDAADRDGVQANRLALAGGLTMGVLLATGIALLAVGARRDEAKRGKLDARRALEPRLTAAGVGFAF